MLVDLTMREPGLVSIQRLAEEFSLPPQRVLQVLTAGSPNAVARQNRWVLEELYQAEGLYFDEGLGLTTVPSAIEHPPKHSQSQKRHLVRDAAHGSVKITEDGKREPRYYAWKVSNSGTIALPISKGFRTTLERYKEYKETKPELDAFAKRVRRVLRDIDALREALRELARAAKGGLPNLAALTALHAVVDIECAVNGDTGVGPMEDLQNFIVAAAMPLFMKKLVQEPEVAEDARGQRDAAAKRILDEWATPDWKDGLRSVIEHSEVVDHDLWEDTFYALESAVALLPLTEHRERFLDQEVLPLEYHAWKEELDPEFEKLLKSTLSPEAAEQYIEGWKGQTPLRESALSIASSFSNATIAMGANLPGPMSLWVAITRISMFHSIAHKARRGLRKAARSEWVLNKIVKFGGISWQEKQRMAFAIGEAYEFRDAPASVRYKHATKLMGVNWDDRLFRGAGFRGATALLAGALLALTVSSNPDESATSAIGYISAMATAGLAFADLGPISDFLMKRSSRLTTLGMGGVAGFVSVLGIVSGGLTLRDGIVRGDALQALEGALAGAGNGLAFIGWLASTAGYVPVPQYVMVVGTVLVLASIAVAVWGMTQNSVEEFVRGVIDHLSDPASFAQQAGLGPTVDLSDEMVSASFFANIPARFQKDLEARGFPSDLAASLCS
ncbi:MAG: hypothetical protein ACE37F_01685 [Nannocystaceae bacterium]|nr:hypothetical protein [bacterium]